jgi:hypothetical protein
LGNGPATGQAVQGSTAQDIFGNVPQPATSAHELFGSSGLIASQPVQAPGAHEVFGGGSAPASQATQEVSVHEVFGAGPSSDGSPQSPSAHDVFGSGSAIGQAPQAPSAHDVFGRGAANVSAHDVFGGGPSSQVATARDVSGGVHSIAEEEARTGPAPIDHTQSMASDTLDLSKQLAEKTQTINVLESRLQEVSSELDEAKTKSSDDEAAVHAWEGKRDMSVICKIVLDELSRCDTNLYIFLIKRPDLSSGINNQGFGEAID